mgnify:CR=1 FL=1
MNYNQISQQRMSSIASSAIVVNTRTKQCDYETDKNGNIARSLYNINKFLDNEYPDAFKMNELTHVCTINGKDWDEDFDLPVIHNNLITLLGITAKSLLKDAIIQRFVSNSYNPLKLWLSSLKWDGVKRLETVFSYYLGAEDTPLIREMTKKWFIAAVKRIYEPGCKFDNIIILQGPQGCGKSRIFEVLSPDFARPASIDNISCSKDAVSTMNKSWIVIFDELATMNKKDMTSVKTFLSRESDTVRLAYSRNDKTFPRTCIFAGSTNETTFLRDYTSSVERRFWIIKCTYEMGATKIQEFTKHIAEQIWAETMHYYKEKPDMYLDLDKYGTQQLAALQKQFKTSEEDGYVDQLWTIVTRKYNLDTNGEFISEDQFADQFKNPATATASSARLFDKIPVSWLNNLAKATTGEKRTHTYIKSVLSDEFDYVKRPYNGLRTMCLVRKCTSK